MKNNLETEALSFSGKIDCVDPNTALKGFSFIRSFSDNGEKFIGHAYTPNIPPDIQKGVKVNLKYISSKTFRTYLIINGEIQNP
ncbi:hypothetical protein K9L16_01600 [Candidatus Pacearchaeota archaeon]|nr:hypothetical protein [Candidatus Pacearchaeota archaeon]